MIASVHIADVGVRSAVRVLRKPPRREATPGLQQANVAVTAQFTASRRRPPAFGRVGLVALWDDDAALDRFLDESPLAAVLQPGWRLRLEPLRAWGSWPGLPEDLSRSRAVQHTGPAAVLTLGRLRLPQTVRFLRTSGRAERAVATAPGVRWATGMAKPPFVATCSLWESGEALSAYAYGSPGTPHPNAIAADRAKPFHHQSAFVRFRPYDSQGHLEGRNPLPADWMA